MGNDPEYASEYNMLSYNQVYTGTAANVSTTSSATGSITFTNIGSIATAGANYFEFIVDGRFRATTATRSLELTLYTGPISGTMGVTIQKTIDNNEGDYNTMRFLRTLSAAEKTSGLMCAFGVSGTSDGGDSAIFTNTAMTLRLVG